ncbi:hypothetical protein E3N88_15197 [Mikania micrantha]|uniref:Uncharacterized protein n=1 Tax=Mikania micrantha TaxID=192012 RepID=A0A5N6NW53_9ASTR|nr:hypothetical protein E3N88_15197 [Mikania micrantha]
MKQSKKEDRRIAGRKKASAIARPFSGKKNRSQYLPIVAPIEQYSDLPTMPFEEAVGRVKAYEERIQSLEAHDDEEGKLLMVKNDRQDERQYGRGRGRGRGFGREMKEDVEEARVEVTKVGFDALIVENLGILGMSAQNGRQR